MSYQPFTINRPITLAQLLAAKERRAALQQRLINRYSLPLISLTITIPGPIKLTPYSLFLFAQACTQIEAYYQQNKIACLNVIKNSDASGPEGFFVLSQTEQQLKQACMDIEDSHPLGRLWDIDVISAQNSISISRNILGYPPRKCLICGNEAKFCARARIHTIDELTSTIETIARQNGYKDKR
ncbi:citrate lyase holo-[acyl-carrier protein] synthase [Orbus sturtevantii]|uniref:citrate lyase holo-[acyl-carrier protein] synthase n=1 Tax=Orbus sturtevantii TaxID=3074109 RepID=UPI00370DB861